MGVDASVPADRSRINLGDPAEVRHWMLLLGCGEAELLVAVRAVGASVDSVREYLARRKDRST